MSKRNKGIHIKYRKDRKCWEVVEYISGMLKRHATGLGSLKSAEEKLAEIIVLRTTPQQNNNEITLGEIMAYYITEHVPSLASQKTAIRCFDRLIPFWGDIKLEDIKKSKCREYIAYRKREFKQWLKKHKYKKKRVLTDQAVRRELEQMQAAIGYAYRDNLISICPHVWKPQKGQPRDRWMTKKEAALLLKAAREYARASDYLELYINIGLYTGARSTAILSLKWRDVDFETGIIDFKKQGETQNKKKSRVPMPRRLLRKMKEARKRGTHDGYVVHRNQQQIKSVKNSLETVYKRAGIEKITSHTMRHTAASWMVQKGVSLNKVAKYLGTTIQVIENTYGHLEPDHLEEVRASFG
ncbi:tyrosine-type recombinase/integrase [Croceimicrobium sp.]|uniref:tyrosine-type recombinase/integrase n=1 Tax=Croceimicrobium sp. TaxID=2828340 RepID=UPI003BAB2E32